MSAAPVAILGAGTAGLIAARHLRRNNVAVQVYEGSDHVAGLAASHVDADGFSYDLGGHFITNRLAAALGVSNDCRVVNRYGEAVMLHGRSYSYPLGLIRVGRFARSALRGRMSPRGPIDSAADWFRAEYGEALANEVAIPLVEAWSGVPATDLAPAVGNKIPTSIPETIMLRAAGRLSHRAVAIGYCGAQPQSAAVFHVYPTSGIGALSQRLADDLGDDLRLEAPVEKIYVEDGRAIGVRVDGHDIDASAVVSTAPVNVLPRLVEGTDILDRFAAFEFRGLVMVNLKLEGRNLLPATLTWTPGIGPLFRLTEAPMSMPWLAPAGKTMVLAEYGATPGDDHWTMSDETLVDRTIEQLKAVGVIPGVRSRLIGSRVLRVPLGYPIFKRSYEESRLALGHGTGVAGLFSIGRNGEFDHILMEDIYWRTTNRLQHWLRSERR